MLAELNDEELPYAFSDYYNDRNFGKRLKRKRLSLLMKVIKKRIQYS